MAATDRETPYKRGNHGDFKQVEASRPTWEEHDAPFQVTQTPDPSWKVGQGANKLLEPKDFNHVSIDPWDPKRHFMDNYKLCISAVVPRPIALVSTRSKDGTSTNLAPFSFFNMVHADPPLFVLGLVTGTSAPNDTLRNLQETGQCVINIINEGIVEAINAAAVNAPYGASEWDISGLHPLYDCKTVPCARVAESKFSMEAKVESIRSFDSRMMPGASTGSLVVLEATHFWAAEDTINKEQNQLDIKLLKPVSRLGGISYGRLMQSYEIPRLDFKKDVENEETKKSTAL